VTEDFNLYLNRKRHDNCHGNNVEMQAICELYNRPVEVYQYSTGKFLHNYSLLVLSSFCLNPILENPIIIVGLKIPGTRMKLRLGESMDFVEGHIQAFCKIQWHFIQCLVKLIFFRTSAPSEALMSTSQSP
jgi:hypothetical protein